MSTLLTLDNPTAYFDRLADVEQRHWWSRALWRLADRWLDRALAGRHGLCALDLGCGTGMTAVRLLRRAEVVDVVGLDPSPEAIELARHRHGFPLVLGSGLDLPFESGIFDLITCFDVLQHLPPDGPRRLSDEMARVLRPGGLALVRSNAPAILRSQGSGGFRLGELNAQLIASGFRVLRASYVNALPALVQEVRGRLGSRRTGHPSGGGLQIRVPPPSLNAMMYTYAVLEGSALGVLRRLPFGHSTLILAQRD